MKKKFDVNNQRHNVKPGIRENNSKIVIQRRTKIYNYLLSFVLTFETTAKSGIKII